MKIRTRIAPSPTGKLHIGTARTALFNYLFAKNQKGDFILRFEDTDRKRSTSEYEENIREGLRWLGLFWDEEYKQMDRLDIYKKYAQKLIKENFAYEKDGAIWFKIPENRTIEFDDLIRGKISFESKDLKDFVIIKSDGIPTFFFSNAIDDQKMRISHVIRGEDHISNTPNQILINEALKFNLPKYAHIPLILNEDKSKLSKRKQAVAVTDYRDNGYLPEAIINFLALLGWNPGNEREYFKLSELVKEFSLKRVQKSPAIFNIEKLNSINNYYLRKKTDTELAKMTGIGEKFINIFKERAKTLKELKNLANEIKKENKIYNPKLLIFKKSNKENTIRGLALSIKSLSELKEEWGSVEKLNKSLSSIVNKNNLSNGDVFWPVRVALSGLEKSPPPAELLWALGKEESLKRVEGAIKKLQK